MKSADNASLRQLLLPSTVKLLALEPPDATEAERVRHAEARPEPEHNTLPTLNDGHSLFLHLPLSVPLIACGAGVAPPCSPAVLHVNAEETGLTTIFLAGMEALLKEISAISSALNALDAMLMTLMAEVESGFQEVSSLQTYLDTEDHQLDDMEDQYDCLPVWGQDINLLLHKVTDLEDQTQRDSF
ncbi:hypothetical protein NDU88_003962 [Pleurodeles waltl]|uniref:Uncharacterized protein n=1 Tax=Pleurodeles waltl TaxID=8319 RepID=A0AAV7NI59_PLEWA|nr:hypothetical protein NDU88_003962 [Pleurodeles waltl]